MPLPKSLYNALEHMLGNTSQGNLTKAAADLTGRYRSRDGIDVFMNTDAHRLAYLACRMPATYAVVTEVLKQMARQMPAFAPKTLCDLGAGPGTASWAAAEAYPSLEKIVLIEKDIHWKEIGSSLMRSSENPVLKEAVWRSESLENRTFEPADLMILSYVIGELPQDALLNLVDAVWKATDQAVVFIEPGTPHGFERIRIVRDRLITLGANLAAPCPHHNACPMKDGNWCHFSVRLERSALHRAVKDVELGYEDEKYSYVAASKTPVPLPEGRIMRHPGRHSGHVEFEICGQTGLEKVTLSKRHKEAYKAARKLDWGDPFQR